MKSDSLRRSYLLPLSHYERHSLSEREIYDRHKQHTEGALVEIAKQVRVRTRCDQALVRNSKKNDYSFGIETRVSFST